MLYSEADTPAGAAETPRAVAHPGPYAPIPAAARLWPVWALVLLPVAFLIVANIVSVPLAVGFSIAGVVQGGLDGQLEFWMLATVILMSFTAFAGSAWLWARAFERRKAATLGFTSGAWRYLRGLAGGVLLAGLLIAVSAPFAPAEPGAIQAGLERLASAQGAAFLAILFVLFAVQGGAEEVVFRGWLLSGVTARRGPMIGAVVSSVGFALVHAHYLLFAPLTGILVVLGVGLIGALLAFCALTERSIWGVCGAHGAYNFILMSAAMAEALGSDPMVQPMDIAVAAFNDITSVTEFDYGVPVSVAVLALLTLGAWAVWTRSRGRSVQPA